MSFANNVFLKAKKHKETEAIPNRKRKLFKLNLSERWYMEVVRFPRCVRQKA